MLQVQFPKLSPIQSVEQERISLDDEGFLGNVFQNIPQAPERNAAIDMCRGMLTEQRKDIRDLVAALSALASDALPALETALGALKETLATNDYEAYLCDGLGPRWGTDHGLRHALRVLWYAIRILSAIQTDRSTSTSALHRLAWMAVFHDVSYVVRGSRSHQVYSAGYADAVLRMLLLSERLPQRCPLMIRDVPSIADGIWGHDKALRRADPLYGENDAALALRDADLLESTMHFDRFVRIAKMNLFYWPEWRFYNPAINVRRRLDTLNSGKGAHLIDAVCDFVKNMFWKADIFFSPEANRIASTSARSPERLLSGIEAFIDWAADAGIGAERLEKTGTTRAQLDGIRRCVESLCSQRPAHGLTARS